MSDQKVRAQAAAADLPAGRFAGFGALVALAVVVCDQLSKWFVYEHVLRAAGPAQGFVSWLTQVVHFSHFEDTAEAYRAVVLLPVLNFVMVWNRGVSFGMFGSDAASGPYILVGVSIFVSLILAMWLWRAQDKFLAAALSLVIGGAFGNVIDRLRFGAVADFIDTHIGDWHWPAFNVADSAIVIGAALMMWDSVFRAGKNDSTKNDTVTTENKGSAQ